MAAISHSRMSGVCSCPVDQHCSATTPSAVPGERACVPRQQTVATEAGGTDAEYGSWKPKQRRRGRDKTDKKPLPAMDGFPYKCNVQQTGVRVNGPYEVSDAVVLTGYGDFDKIKVSSAKLPKRIPDYHVQIKVYYCGINFTDNYMRLGIIRCEKFPVIMGSECSGVVQGVGQGITDITVGQRVLCLKMQGGLFRRFVHVPRRNCFVIPDRMRMSSAVCLGLDCVVAHMCLFQVGNVRDTDRVFMQSIAGGVGISMIQLARKLVGDNLKIFGTAAKRKHEDLLYYGANHVFTHEEDYVTEITQNFGGGVDIVINTNGGTDITKCLKMLRPFGRLINIGSNSTAICPRPSKWGMATPSWDNKHMTPREIVDSNGKITGFHIGDLMDAFPEKVQAIVEEAFRLFCCMGCQNIETRISQHVPFEKIADGIQYMCRRQNMGKVMVYVEHEWHQVPASHAAEIFSLPGTSGEPCQEKEDTEEGEEAQEKTDKQQAEGKDFEKAEY